MGAADSVLGNVPALTAARTVAERSIEYSCSATAVADRPITAVVAMIVNLLTFFDIENPLPESDDKSPRPIIFTQKLHCQGTSVRATRKPQQG